VAETLGRSRRPRHAFVFAVVGERHVRSLATALQFLKKFTRAEIVVVQGRSRVRAAHDQVISVSLPDSLDDRQASIFLKTSLGVQVRGLADSFCYLDSDVIAVNEGVDSIFEQRAGAINFALDHVDIDRFSRWAVHCGCEGGSCSHLRDAVANKFGIKIDDGNWRLWNGGVFLFDEASDEFLATWHSLTCTILGDPYWRTRDQGTLAATVWKSGLSELKPLDSGFNLVVDRMWGIPEQRRSQATAADFKAREDYALTNERGLPVPRFIHFVNGGVGTVGWKNWDEVSALLHSETPTRQS
jgi:hypothetical protein